MFNIGPQELLLILLVALVIVGPKRLPELSRTIGRGLREFRKAQDEVTKTIRLGLDDAEPTAPPAKTGAATVGPTPEGSTDQTASGTADDEVADVARTLGRGLAEIRRARREVQRSFRVDLSDTSSRTPSKPRSTAAPPDQRTPGAAEAPAAAETPDATDRPAEHADTPPDERPTGPEAVG